MYIEHKTDQSDRGEAWIGAVEYSKSGRTIYFNGQAFKAPRSGNFNHNFYDLETGEEYWISGVKKNGQDRHWCDGGRIKIDRAIVEEYLAMVDFDILENQYFELVNVVPTDIQKFVEIENQSSRPQTT